jgi:hypothetical protein
MKLFKRTEPAHREPGRADCRSDVAVETHLRIMVEQMVREGRSEREITLALRRAA